MSHLSLDATDLVEHFKLDSSISETVVVHTRYTSDPSRRQRKVKVEDRWNRRTRYLGGGGFGAVWLEERSQPDPNAPNVRAVKEVAKQKMVENGIDIRRELLALAKLSKHDFSFVTFYGWFEDNVTAFLAMEYLPYGDLYAYMQKHQLATLKEKEVVSIIHQIAEGVDIMHKFGITHRDLKPQNIFVVTPDPQWWVKIGDFGISKRVNATETALRTQVGSSSYMAPEIFDPDSDSDSEGEGGKDDFIKYTAAVDIWSLGCIAFELCIPESARNTLSKFRRRRAQFPEKALSDHGISPEGVDFLRHVLDLKPSRRLTSSAVLESPWLASDEEDEPTTPTLPPRPVASASSISSFATMTSAMSLKDDNNELRTTQSESNVAAHARPLETRLSGTTLNDTKLAATTLKSNYRPSSRNANYPDYKCVDTFNAPSSSWIRAIDISPDKTRIAIGFEDHWVHIARADYDYGFSVRAKLQHGLTSVKFSPSGLLLACGGEKTVVIIDVSSGAITHRLEGHKGKTNAVDFFKNDDTVVSAAADKTIRMWDLRTGFETKCFEGHSMEINALAFPADYSTIISASTDDTVRIWDPETGDIIQSIKTGHTNTAVAVSRDGSRVMALYWDGRMALYGTGTGDEISRQKMSLRWFGYSLDPAVASAQFSRDGDFIVIAVGTKEVTIWDRDLMHVRQKLTGHPKTASLAALSKDDSMIVSASTDGSMRVWKFDDLTVVVDNN